MRRNLLTKLTAAVALVFFAVGAGDDYAAAGQQKSKRKTKVDTRYDKKKDETHASIGPFEVWRPPSLYLSGEVNYESLDLGVSFTYSGRRIVKPESVTLVVFSTSQGGPQFNKKRDLRFSTDSGQYELGEMELVGVDEARVERIGSGSGLRARELLRKTIPFESFARIARSERADVEIGNRKFKLQKEHLEALRNFASLMEQEGLEF